MFLADRTEVTTHKTRVTSPPMATTGISFFHRAGYRIKKAAMRQMAIKTPVCRIIVAVRSKKNAGRMKIGFSFSKYNEENHVAPIRNTRNGTSVMKLLDNEK